MATNVMWFRRDLRLTDNPALVAASSGHDVLGLFVLDPRLLETSGAPRRAVLIRTLRALDEQLDGRLVIRHGDPATVVTKVAREVKAEAVHCGDDFGPYGRQRDQAVRATLEAHDIPLLRTGSPYAVSPGRVHRDAPGTPAYQVYGAFYRAWQTHGWPAPVAAPNPAWVSARSDGLPRERPLGQVELPSVGEAAARRAWHAFLKDGLADYGRERDHPGADRTSRMSVHLKWGTIHPRTLLADLSPKDEIYRRELAWREFYAAVLADRPDSARGYYRPELARMDWDNDEQKLAAWQRGLTGYPIVDAGMRQLLAEGFMHNRVRMIVASFLVKDLHIEWTYGARHFMNHLIDGDLASNSHGWQWVAGCGTDPAPFFRIFNPRTQGKKFDPDGHYVRRYVPELKGVPDRWIHEPAANPDGMPSGYPEPIVDHAVERIEALARYQNSRG